MRKNGTAHFPALRIVLNGAVAWPANDGVAEPSLEAIAQQK